MAIEVNNRVAREVQQLEKEGMTFAYIRRRVEQTYGVKLTPWNIGQYETMELPPEQPQPISTYHPTAQLPSSGFVATSPLSSTSRPGAYTDSPREIETHQREVAQHNFLHGITKVGRVVGPLALLGIAGLLLFFSLHPKQELTQDQIYLQQDLQIAHTVAIESLPPHLRKTFERYIISHPDYRSEGDKYWIDLNNNTQTVEGTFSKDMLGAIAKASKANKVDVKALMTSLFILNDGPDATNMQPTSSGQIVATHSDPLNVFVYNITPQGPAIDNSATRELQGTLNQIMDALRTNQTADGRARAITQIYQLNPQATAMVMNGMGGPDFERDLREKQGQEIANQYSAIVRGNLTDAAVNAGSGNFGAALGYGFAAWLNTEAAKAAVKGLDGGASGNQGFNPTFPPSGPGEIFRDKDGDLWRRSPGGATEYLGKDKSQKDCKPSLLWPGAC